MGARTHGCLPPPDTRWLHHIMHACMHACMPVAPAAPPTCLSHQLLPPTCLSHQLLSHLSLFVAARPGIPVELVGPEKRQEAIEKIKRCVAPPHAGCMHISAHAALTPHCGTRPGVPTFRHPRLRADPSANCVPRFGTRACAPDAFAVQRVPRPGAGGLHPALRAQQQCALLL